MRKFKNMIQKSLIFTGLVLVSFFIFSNVNTETVKAEPFVCSSVFYQVIFGTLYELDPDTGEYVSIGYTGQLSTNAIGYNIQDNYIYGIYNQSDTDRALVRIANDGSPTVLGPPAGLPQDNTYVSGDFDENGNLYVHRPGTNELYRIDVTTNTATLISMTSTLSTVNDLVYINDLLYGLGGEWNFIRSQFSYRRCYRKNIF